MNTANSLLASSKARHWPTVYALLVGAFLGFGLIKFGNPVILDHLITQPASEGSLTQPGLALFMGTGQDASGGGIEDFYEPWSFVRGLWLLGVLAVLACKDSAWKTHPPRWLWLCIGGWFFWQIVAAFDTVNVNLTKNSLAQFAACLACLFIGWHGLPQGKEIRFLWVGIAAGLVLTLWRGFTQHHGGLEAMRNFIYEQPNWRDFPPDLIKRVSGGRIFGTLVYPNALAGAILLLLAPTAVGVWQLTARLPNIGRGLAVGFIVYLGIACLIWTGSKSGWLIALGMLVAALLQLRIPARLRLFIVLALCVAGLAGFFVRYSKYFERGATSVSARFDYWRAAWQTAVEHPLTGTGPGTFMVPYKRLKAPESEMARLTHNDYLEQACDSGFPGFLAFIAFVGGSFWQLYRHRGETADPLRTAVFLGLSGIFVQSFVEFGLYVPAVAWPAFVLLGWMLGNAPARAVGDRAPAPPPGSPGQRRPGGPVRG